jgi:DNA-binding NtrC family response regulator
MRDPDGLLEVLVVDDEPDTRELLAEVCKAQDLSVAMAHDGRAAIAAVERAPARFGIVILDLHLPGADGFDVLRRIRELNPSIYVVMITGYATIDAAVRAVKEGAYDFLAKPFAMGQLEIVLTRIRDRMTLEGENRLLLRQMQIARGAGTSMHDFTQRFDRIEKALARLESLLLSRARL